MNRDQLTVDSRQDSKPNIVEMLREEKERLRKGGDSEVPYPVSQIYCAEEIIIKIETLINHFEAKEYGHPPAPPSKGESPETETEE